MRLSNMNFAILELHNIFQLFSAGKTLKYATCRETEAFKY